MTYFLTTLSDKDIVIPKNGNKEKCKSKLVEDTIDSTETYSLTNSKKFSQREDVLNKTLLRSLKKYFTDKFNQKSDFMSLTPGEKYWKFKAKIFEFTKEYYQSLFNLDEYSPELQEDVLYYIGILVNPNLIKRFLKKRKYIRFFRGYYECVYKYSHRKLNKLFADPVLKFVFEIYRSSGAAEEMVINDETLSKNKICYRNWLEVFTDSFELKEYSLKDKRKDSNPNKSSNKISAYKE